jgi:hypothetical protein
MTGVVLGGDFYERRRETVKMVVMAISTAGLKHFI